MKLSDFNMVTGCGGEDRVVIRYKDTCYIGCFTGTREEAIRAIGNKYKDDGKDVYITKINELYDTDITSYKERGIDITTDDNRALRWASAYGYLKVVKYLVSQGADVTADDNYALQSASKDGYLKMVKYLVKHGVDITTSDNYAVQRASNNGHLKVVKYLVSQGADVTASDNLAIQWASENGHLEVVKYLVSQGAVLEQ